MLRCTFEAFEHGMDKLNSEKSYCQKWDSNPRLQSRLRPERSALDRSAILTIEICVVKVSWALWPVWINVPFKTLFSSFLRRVTYKPRSIYNVSFFYFGNVLISLVFGLCLVTKKRLSDVGFEPTPSFEDQNTLIRLSISSQGITLSLAP